MKKNLLIDFALLLILAIVSIVICLIFLHNNILNFQTHIGNIKILMGVILIDDSPRLLFNPYHLMALIWIKSVFLVFVFKVSFNKACIFSSNIILITFTALFILAITKFQPLYSKLESIFDEQNGWAVYPPVSELPQSVTYDPNPSNGLLLLIQFLLLMILIGMCFLTAKNMKNKGPLKN